MATIDKNFGTLPFCRRYLDRLGESAYLLAVSSQGASSLEKRADQPFLSQLRDLEEKELVRGYLPLADDQG